MPIYEYQCCDCEDSFEVFVRNGESVECPRCHSARLTRQLSRFSAGPRSTSPSASGQAPVSGGCCGGACGCG